jgi:putative peptidoglycan lipid II flippase
MSDVDIPTSRPLSGGRYGRLGALAGVSGLSAIALLLSLGTQIEISKHLGTSAALDGYLLAYTIVMFTTFYVAPVREALGPVFFNYLQKSPQEAQRFLAPLLGWMIIGLSLSVLAALAIALLLGRGWIPIAAPAKGYAVDAIIWLLPAIFLTGFSEVLNGLFACYDRPVLQQASRVIQPAAMLAAILLLVEGYGVRALVAGVIAGQAAMLMVQWMVLAKFGLRVQIGWQVRAESKLWTMVSALVLTYFGAQLYALIERLAFFSSEAGLLAAFNYGVVLTNVAVTILGLTITNTIYPRLLVAANAEDRAGTTRIVGIAMQWLMFLNLGIALAGWIFASEVVEVVFARGRFDAISVTMTTATLRAAIFTCAPIGVQFLIGRLLMAGHRSKELGAIGASIAMTGIATIMVATALKNRELLISHWLIANSVGAIVALTLVSRYPGDAGRDLTPALWTVIRQTVVAGALCYLAWLHPLWSGHGSTWSTLLLGTPSVLAIYTLACWAMRALPPIAPFWGPHWVRS